MQLDSADGRTRGACKRYACGLVSRRVCRHHRRPTGSHFPAATVRLNARNVPSSKMVQEFLGAGFLSELTDEFPKKKVASCKAIARKV